MGIKLGIHSIRRGHSTDEALLEQLGELDALLEETFQLCRTLMAELSPLALSEVGLVAAVGRLGTEMKRIHGLDVRVMSEGEIPANTDGVVPLLFQAVRELLFNVVKHAGVKSAQVRISRPTDTRVQIEVADEGAGFDAMASGRQKSSATGLGLFGIQERIAHMGGRVDVDSAPGRGTRVTLQAEIRTSVKGDAHQAPGGDSAEASR